MPTVARNNGGRRPTNPTRRSIVEVAGKTSAGILEEVPEPGESDVVVVESRAVIGSKRQTLFEKVIAALIGRGVQVKEDDILITPWFPDRHKVQVNGITAFVKDSRSIIDDLVRAIMSLLGIKDSHATPVAA